jgi:hypothetical protein
MSFNTATLTELRAAKDRALAKIRDVREKHGKKIGIGFGAAETTGTAYAFGFMNGRFGGERGEMSIGGVVPIDLLVGEAVPCWRHDGTVKLERCRAVASSSGGQRACVECDSHTEERRDGCAGADAERLACAPDGELAAQDQADPANDVDGEDRACRQQRAPPEARIRARGEFHEAGRPRAASA